MGAGVIELADLVPFETTNRTITLHSPKHGEKGQIQIRMLFRPEIVAKARAKTSTFSSAGRAMTQVGGLPLGAGRSVGRKALGLFGGRGDKGESTDELPPDMPAPPSVEGNGNANGGAHGANGSIGSATGVGVKPLPLPTPVPGPGTLKVTLHRVRDLGGIEEGDTAKPYAILKIGDKDHKSKHVKSNTPEW